MFDHVPPTSYVGWGLPKRLDGTGDAWISCKKDTFDFFKLELLPPPEVLNPALPGYQGGRLRFSGLGRKVARGNFRIAFDAVPGRKKPRMARIQIQSDWIDETYSVFHNHLIAQGVPYWYLCNKHGNSLGPNWQAHTGVIV